MSETLANAFYGGSFFVSLLVVAGLWRAAAKAPENRPFWGLLALGFSLNLIADLAWGILFLIDPDLWLNWIDYLYVGRYLLVFLAFWRYPKPWHWQKWLATLACILWGLVLLWLLVTLPVKHFDLAYARAGMIFPVLDAGILYAALFRWQTVKTRLKPALLWLGLAQFAYGMANWFNYSVRIKDPAADSLAALILWLLSSIFTGVAVWRFLWGKEADSPGTNGDEQRLPLNADI
jgi:hypothetical protein